MLAISPNVDLTMARAAAQLDVVISEIAWMGTTTDYLDEWIELYNTTSQDISLDGWTLNAADTTPSISLDGTIPAKWYFLLERTNDSSAPACTADQIYTGALGNDGEDLYLRDGDANLIDRVEAWHAGDNGTKETMLRTNTSILGTSASAWADGSVNGEPECVATVVVLSSFTATGHDGHVLVAWETASEIDNDGFNLWRSEAAEGEYAKLNTHLIPARGGPTTGASYSYDDEAVTNGVTYRYKLEDVDLYGVSTFHGPVAATPQRLHWLYLPLVLKGG